MIIFAKFIHQWTYLLNFIQYSRIHHHNSWKYDLLVIDYYIWINFQSKLKDFSPITSHKIHKYFVSAYNYLCFSSSTHDSPKSSEKHIKFQLDKKAIIHSTIFLSAKSSKRWPHWVLYHYSHIFHFLQNLYISIWFDTQL